ncbi:hypothetical protein Tco_0744947 [Tanacetum coccineum]
MASTSFAHLSKQVLVEELKEKSIYEKEVLAVVEEEGHTWMTPFYEYLMEEILSKKRERKEPCAARQANYVLREIHEGSCNMHAGPRSVVVKALRSGYYWPTKHADAKKLIWERNSCQVHRLMPRNPQQNLTPITSPWPFYKWGIAIAEPFPEAPGKVKFLIAHRTMIKSSNAETPFSLTYGTKAVIPVEIGMPTLRTAKVDMIKMMRIWKSTYTFWKRKENSQQSREAKSKAKMEKYYNARVRNTSFKPGDLFYRKNKASHAEDRGKLGPKWEGPYEVTKALGKGAYNLRDRNGNILPRTWNA